MIPIKYKYTEKTNNGLIIIVNTLGQDESFIKELRNKIYNVKETEIIQGNALTYRIINSWESVGLIDDERDNEGVGWRKFSQIDMALIAIINRLRNFGMSTDKIKKVKEYLYTSVGDQFSPLPKEKQPKVLQDTTLLECFYFRVALPSVDDNTYLLLEYDGTATFMGEDDINLNLLDKKLPDVYLLINLNLVLEQLVKSDKIRYIVKKPVQVSESELEIFKTLREDSSDNILIKKDKTGKPDLLEKEYNINLKEAGGLHNVIQSFEFGRIKDTIFRDGKMETVKVSKQIKLHK